MVPLRYPWLWMVLGWLLVSGVVFGSVAPGEFLGDRLFDDKIMHGVSYSLLTMWFAGLYTRRRHVWIGLFAFLLGVGMEFAQSSLSYRSFDPEDMVANGVGIGIGLLFSFYYLAGWCRRVETMLGIGHVGH